ncbi:hypothetical protein OIU79_017456 [Salix purpurea]|uniref:Uncharacterized protein n=1 Tax=Salix purpurea TaxID=77065 RepID=A0A9Q0WYH9_SALPP|nr:hypothetical protein OIU79_017456 [Salix purpurea]
MRVENKAPSMLFCQIKRHRLEVKCLFEVVDYRVGLSNKPGFSMISLGGEINLLDTILGIHVKKPSLSHSLSE